LLRVVTHNLGAGEDIPRSTAWCAKQVVWRRCTHEKDDSEKATHDHGGDNQNQATRFAKEHSSWTCCSSVGSLYEPKPGEPIARRRTSSPFHATPDQPADSQGDDDQSHRENKSVEPDASTGRGPRDRDGLPRTGRLRRHRFIGSHTTPFGIRPLGSIVSRPTRVGLAGATVPIAGSVTHCGTSGAPR
jgi:hypothetical protein